MKNKFKIVVIVLLSFLFFGCPPAHNKEYVLIGKLPIEKKDRFYKIELKDGKFMYTTCYYHHSFIEAKEIVLISVIKFETENHEEIPTIDAYSSTLGRLIKKDSLSNNSYRHYDSSAYYYEKPINKLSRKLYRQLENDTISIILNDDQKLLFTRKNGQ